MRQPIRGPLRLVTPGTAPLPAERSLDAHSPVPPDGGRRSGILARAGSSEARTPYLFLRHGTYYFMRKIPSDARQPPSRTSLLTLIAAGQPILRVLVPTALGQQLGMACGLDADSDAFGRQQPQCRAGRRQIDDVAADVDPSGHRVGARPSPISLRWKSAPASLGEAEGAGGQPPVRSN